MKRQTKIGVKDIAAKAGVSRGTVDRVLNDRGEVKLETYERVKAIVKELGYKPNLLAKSLATKKTTQIAIVMPYYNSDNPYWEQPIKGIEKAAEELDTFNVEIIYKQFDASSESSFKEVLDEVCAGEPDGIIFNPVFKSATLDFTTIFNKQKIPYIFIDANIDGVGKLGYFGQNAEQSGLVAAKLMSVSVPKVSEILIVKQSNKVVFSQHIELRVKGFGNYFKSHNSSDSISITTIEIDLQNVHEPHLSLNKIFKGKQFDGIFVPNSRAFKVAEFIKNSSYNNIVTIGYDLVPQNIEYLKSGEISFLLSQKPEEQAYKAIMALFNNLIIKKDVKKTTYSSIDIVVKENLECYHSDC